MSLIKRVQLLEQYYGTDDNDTTPEALIIYTVDSSRADADPLPITRFTVSGRAIHRLPDELYPAFEARALKEAFNQLPARQPARRSGPMPVPCLIADGSLQE